LGVKEPFVLESAIEGVRSGYYASLAEITANYIWAIALGHPFHGGNKRAAIGSAIIFLSLNTGKRAKLIRPYWYRTMLAVAARRTSGMTKRALIGRIARAMGGDVRVIG